MTTYPLIKAVEESDWNNACTTNVKLQHYISILRPIVGDAFEEQKSVLHAAASIGDNINSTFGKGETLLHWAASRTFDSFNSSITGLCILLHLGADPNARDRLGRTPLHWVTTYWNTSLGKESSIPKDLLLFGASPDIPDMYGVTPLYLARWANAEELVQMLEPVTDLSLNNWPNFVHKRISFERDIRRSKIANWMQDQAGDRTKNRERICQFMCTPGMGIIEHNQEAQQQNHQIFSLLNRISDEICRENPVFEFRPYLAGSTAEDTKRGFPDEKDIIIHLEKFTERITPEPDTDDPHKLVKLRLAEDAPAIPEKYIRHGFLNRTAILRDFIALFQRAMLLVELWNSDELTNIFPGESASCRGAFDVIHMAADEGDICTFDVVWCGEHYKQITVSMDIVPAIMLTAGTLKQPMKGTLPDIYNNYTLCAILKSKADTFVYVDESEETDRPIAKSSGDIMPVEKHSTFYMESRVDDIVFSDSENDSDIDYHIPDEEGIDITKEELKEIEEEVREEGRLYVRKAVDIGENSFYISFCALEVTAMKSLPDNLRVAMVLSKALVDFIPEIRTAANKGAHPERDFYEGRKDISSYMIKMALLHSHKKYLFRDQQPDSTQTENIPGVETYLQRSVYRNCSYCQSMQCHTQEATDVTNVDTSSRKERPRIGVPDVSQLCISQMCTSTLTSDIRCTCCDNRCTLADFSSRVEDISLWVERIFIELEEAAEKRHLPVFFDPQNNALDKLITLSEQKGFPYPGLSYLRVHCKMVRALVQI
ncbi:uncharacterized protein LOC117103914 [Anneissia japonica]|uniref:uncharacterized protein LOC117103914 n=1 Tax=Anneissia japonica TaxID=1529436 RepID=UPI001425A71D|nr:uncharacterized protein LOC117103914 [Anneissia japonica]